MQGRAVKIDFVSALYGRDFDVFVRIVQIARGRSVPHDNRRGKPVRRASLLGDDTPPA